MPAILATQEDHSSRPAEAKMSQDPISTNSWVWWNVPIIPATLEA
jgi:hypothetical protein